MSLYRVKLWSEALLALFVFFGAADVRAAGMYCGGELITEGMTKLDAISKCGEPDLKEVASVNTFGVRLRGAFRASTTAVGAWHYNCGEGRFNRILYFDGERLALIENSKSYGSGPERCA